MGWQHIYAYFRICWYAADKYVRDLKAKEEFSSRVLEGLAALASFLVSEARSIERGTGKDTREQVPGDRVRDPGALARELRWRVRNARGLDSDGEGGPPTPVSGNGTTSKRKRVEETTANVPVPVVPKAEGEDKAKQNGATPELPVSFRNFLPRLWTELRRDSAVTTCWVDPESIQEEEAADAKLVSAGTPGAAELQTKIDTVIKIRRSKNEEGTSVFERQTIMRTLDIYTWDDKAKMEDVHMESADANADVNVPQDQENVVNTTSIPLDTSMSAPGTQASHS